MTTALTLRATKGSALTHAEMDANLTNLQTTADDAAAAIVTLGTKAEAAALGVAASDTNMGSFTGATISDNATAKAAIQALETAVETKANASALGVTASAANMGTFTGSTIADNQTAKVGMQSLETAVELRELAAFSHSDSYTAGTVRKKIQQFINPMDAPYSATGDGTANDYTAFAAADIAAAAAGLPLFITKTHRLNTSYTTTANLVFIGGKIKPASGTTFTIATAISTAPTQIFDVSLGGTITFSMKPDQGRAEWWGAVLDNGAVDSAAAIQACITATGKLYFPKGLYYGTAGLDGTGAVIRGEGELLSGYSCSSATDHLLKTEGVVSTSFATGGDWEGFALVRSVTPTTPASAADDVTQGHGIHLDLVTNPRIRNVYTYNNLVELYHARCLSPEIDNVRGLRQTGGGTDRWAGYWCAGDPTGMPGGWATGPSGNPSARIGKLNMVAYSSVGTDGTANLSRNYVLEDNLQDLWIEHAEAGGGGHTQFYINPNGTQCSDAYIANAIADGFLNKGFHIQNMPIGNNFEIKKAWMAPAAAAASGASPYGLRAELAHGLKFHGTGDFTNAPAIDGVYSTDANNQDIEVRLTNCQRPVYTVSVSSSRLKAEGICTLTAADAGYIVNSVGGSHNEIIAGGTTTGTKQWLSGVELDATAANNIVNVAKVLAAAFSGARYSVAGVAVTTQGDVGGHVVINPGAGAML